MESLFRNLIPSRTESLSFLTVTMLFFFSFFFLLKELLERLGIESSNVGEHSEMDLKKCVKIKV